MGINLNSDADDVLRAYSDSDWAGCTDTRRSTGGFCTFLGTNIISWSAKRHSTVSRSSMEAEYRSLSLAATELKWIASLLKEVGVQQTIVPQMYCDNLSAIHLTANPALHSRSKHFDVDFHYVRERVALGELVVKHISSRDQIADIFTKSLLRMSYTDLRHKLGVVVKPATSLRGPVSEKPPCETEDSNIKYAAKPPGEKEGLLQQADMCIKHPNQRLPPRHTHALQHSEKYASQVSMPRTKKLLQPIPLFNRFHVLEMECC